MREVIVWYATYVGWLLAFIVVISLVYHFVPHSWPNSTLLRGAVVGVFALLGNYLSRKYSGAGKDGDKKL